MPVVWLNLPQLDQRYGGVAGSATYTGDNVFTGTNTFSGSLRTSGSGTIECINNATFGAGIFGSASGYTTIGNSGNTAVLQAGHGTLADTDISLRAKGAGSVFLRPGSGGNLLIENAILASSANAGVATALPAQPLGYITTMVSSSTSGHVIAKIPYFDN